MNLLAAQAKLAPQPNDAITAGVESLSDEFRLQAQRPMGFTGLDVRRLDGDLQPFVVLRALRRRAIERRITWNNLISNQFSGLNDITVPGTLRDCLILLAVVLEQQTDLQPTQIVTDTGAYSDVVFGLFRLLSYRFSPRSPPWRSRTSCRFQERAKSELATENSSIKPNSLGSSKRLRQTYCCRATFLLYR